MEKENPVGMLTLRLWWLERSRRIRIDLGGSHWMRPPDEVSYFVRSPRHDSSKTARLRPHHAYPPPLVAGSSRKIKEKTRGGPGEGAPPSPVRTGQG